MPGVFCESLILAALLLYLRRFLKAHFISSSEEKRAITGASILCQLSADIQFFCVGVVTVSRFIPYPMKAPCFMARSIFLLWIFQFEISNFLLRPVMMKALSGPIRARVLR